MSKWSDYQDEPDSLHWPTQGNSRNPSHAEAGYAVPDHPGTVYVPEMGTYVDADVAASLGLGQSRAAASVAPAEQEPPAYFNEPAEEGNRYGLNDEDEMDPEAELEALYDRLDELEGESEDEETGGDDGALGMLRNCFETEAFDQAAESLINGNDEQALAAIAEASGLNRHNAIGLLETIVHEAEGHTQGALGQDQWNSLVYAASRPGDPQARRIVAKIAQGGIHPANLQDVYRTWYDSLPDE